MTPALFKRSIRDLQVWCSSCMIAFSGSDAVAVLIGAKRASATLVHKIAVHPDHRRQGHGRHLLASLGSKLSILGPPRIVAEVPETFAAARGLFGASGYLEEGVLTDYILDGTSGDAGGVSGSYVIPFTVDDLSANGFLVEHYSQTCWERSAETLAARKDDIEGVAVVSEDHIEAFILYIRGAGEIVSLRSFIDDGGVRLRVLIGQLRAQGVRALRFPKVHPAELSNGFLEALGFRRAGVHVLCAGMARAA